MIQGDEGMARSQVDRLEEEQIHPPPMRIVEEDEIERRQPCRFALWNLDLHTTSQVWQLMQRMLRPRMFRQVVEIRRVCQKRDGRVRFEVLLPWEWQIQAEQRLERAKFRFSFRWKRMDPRAGGGPTHLRTERIMPVVDHFRLCSLNINGATKKGQALREYLYDKKLSTVCLQETLRKPNHWRLHFPGFGSVEQPSQDSAGRRGMAMGVDNSILTAFPVGTQTDFQMFQRVFGSKLLRPFVLGNVYLPHRHVTEEGAPLYVPAMEGLIRTIGNLRRKYPNDPVIVMGDFNMSHKKLDTYILRMLGMIRVPIIGDPRTRVKTGRRGDIDHVLISTEHKEWIQGCSVDRECDLSDHWPLMVEFAAQKRGEVAAPVDLVPRWQVAKLKKFKRDLGQVGTIVNHNRFHLLSDELETKTLEEAAQHFVDQCNVVGDEVGARTQPTPRGGYVPTKKHTRAAAKQRRLWAEYLHIKALNGSIDEVEEAKQGCNNQRKITKRILREASRQRWARKVVEATVDFKEDPKEAWAWTSTTAGWRRKGGGMGIQPVHDMQGNLCTAPADIDTAWTAHYKSLAEDTIGHSQDFEYWRGVIPDRQGTGVTGKKVTEGVREELNKDIEKAEVKQILLKLKSWKAPGSDRIPVDFFKLFAADDNEALQVLTYLCNRMFRDGALPKIWTTAMVVSVFKKGDPTDTGNYRGISLMDSTLKVLLSILTARLQRAMEEGGMVVREQAGFRPREECMGQVLTLYEVLRRRYLAKKDTYVLFLDFQKAYDVVPHGALFRELEVMGVTGRLLTFIKALYAESKVAVRKLDGTPGDSFHLERGLRQGCPMSPILFTIFINTQFDGEEELGCDVPGIPDHKLPGLMFADDTVGVTGTLSNLQKTLERVIKWSDSHGMTFGVGKCALMAFLWNDPTRKGAEVFADKAIWHIHGVPIPTPQEYVYLGIRFQIDLMHAGDEALRLMVSAQISKGRKALMELRPFLSCASIPQTIKLAVVRCVIIAKMLWGAELWGMSENRIRAAQNVLNLAMRYILGVRGPQSFISVGCMMRELGLQPIWAMVASRRVRIYYKFPSLSTWASLLIQNPGNTQGDRRRTWVGQTEWWLKRMKIPLGGGEYVTANRGAFCGVDIEDVVKATRDHITYRWNLRKENTTGASIAYDTSGFKPLMSKAIFPPGLGRGIYILQQFRCRGYWTGYKLDKGDLCRGPTCVFCGMGKIETPAHIMVECTAWSEYRERYFGNDLKTWREHLGYDGMGPLPSYIQDEICLIALGGTVRGYAATHYYPNSVKYTVSEAIRASITDPPGDPRGPIQYQSPQRRRPPPMSGGRILWEVYRPPGPDTPDPIPRQRNRGAIRGAAAILPEEWERIPALPVFMSPSTRGVLSTHDQEPEEKGTPEETPRVNRQLRREFEAEDEEDCTRPLWGRCAMFGVAAFLNRVDRDRVARISELGERGDLAEFLFEGQSREG